jgi:hypothetical protein
MHPNSLDLEAFAVGEETESVKTHLVDCADCRAFVEKLGGLAPVPMPKPAPKPLRLMSFPIKGASILVPLAAAALFFFVLRRPPTADIVGPVSTASHQTVDPETTFKGGIQVAIVRDRGGNQQRYVQNATIRPGDRLRVEVALDREQAILAGVLGDDDSWLVLMEGTRSPGTHFSEKSARVDETPLRGTVIVGSPEAVDLARKTRDFKGVKALRLEWE